MISKSKKNKIDNVVLNGILTIVPLKGTMTEVLYYIRRVTDINNIPNIPGSPGALRIVVNRIVNRLRSRGVSVKFSRATNHNRTRLVKFTH